MPIPESITGAVKGGSNGRRIPAANLENLVITKLRSFLADRGALLNAIETRCPDAVEQTRLIRRALRIAEDLAEVAPDQIFSDGRERSVSLTTPQELGPGFGMAPEEASTQN